MSARSHWSSQCCDGPAETADHDADPDGGRDGDHQGGGRHAGAGEGDHDPARRHRAEDAERAARSGRKHGAAAVTAAGMSRA